MFYIRNIKDEHRIMSQATNKETGFSSQQHFQLLWCLMSHIFHYMKTYHIMTFNYNSKLKLARKRMRMRFRKKFDIFTQLANLCCHLRCGCWETKSLCKSYEGKKSYKKENDKVTEWYMERPWIPQGGFTAPHLNPQLLQPIAIKLNSAWKKEVSKSAWIEPWLHVFILIHEIWDFKRINFHDSASKRQVAPCLWNKNWSKLQISQFTINGFNTPYYFDRNGNGGGVIIYVRQHVPSKLLSTERNLFARFFVEINWHKKEKMSNQLFL